MDEALKEEPARSNVLLVEDNHANVIVAREFLIQFNYTYTVATSGAQGIELFTTGQFDVILMDIQMPGISGIEAAEKIRALEKEEGRHKTPIVAMTANYATSDLMKWHAVGIEDVVPKPFNVKYFGKMLEKYCKK